MHSKVIDSKYFKQLGEGHKKIPGISAYLMAAYLEAKHLEAGYLEAGCLDALFYIVLDIYNFGALMWSKLTHQM